MRDVPDLYLRLQDISDAPDVKAFIDAWKRHRQQGITNQWESAYLVMFDHALARTQELGMCRAQILEIRDWENTQRKLEASHGTGANAD